ncbi:MAG: adenosylcobinamide-phosphate synthase CbiB [Deltaproteobacteria bacterium]|jgi:adenosylcobinamide-phosphate synthase|nr:adenosylcobinamide-phosphate synthase CbiB [Deltaproteobacteria bacterium]
MTALLILAALALDWLLGAPQNWPHPVRLLGRLIVWGEKACLDVLGRRPSRPAARVAAGAFLTAGVVAVAGLAAWLTLRLLGALSSVLWTLAAVYLCYAALCLRDLLTHAENVEKALEQGHLEQARSALAWFVGRDTAGLDPAATRRAVTETLAENFSDGLAAPFLALALGGPVLAWMYKAVNTLDSMVGYKNERYLHLGRCSAKLDDLANFLPARLAALLLILAAWLRGLDHRAAWRLWRREGRFHSSPNSGQTEAAMAGALGVFLGGRSFYGGLAVDKPVINAGGGESTARTVAEAMALVKTASLLAAALAVGLEGLIWAWAAVPWGWGLPF